MRERSHPEKHSASEEGRDTARLLEVPPAPPVCIAGMHRSGTSTLSQLLYRLGLDLGDESEMFAGDESNADGYFENRRFVAVSNEIFRLRRGGWDLPPDLEPGWFRKEEFAKVREEAAALMEDFAGGGAWGWKDPRATLTMGLWLDLAPDLRVVAPVRNPLEVAASLRSRGASSVEFGLNLWTVYNRRLLEEVPEGQLMITHYEAFFRRPQEELRRVLDFCGMHASEQLISLVRSRVVRGLRHHLYTAQDLLEADPSGEVRELYAQLCNLAGWPAER
ncbi:Sulfotransferase family [Rubrobacter radiotolerans]|uniref:Sulfotransferase n=1 Tax=Rubrobacter radiotolerans TaxID=42256 RepID=A0A023WYZ9_RUBRA|nr:sulfotransferase [Rubrobacter radiotolerans]AHY45447.1 Sulfotransferase family [Rubrobacter radiotolerans]MDX5892858.1 sulfotransferase [Rubrobacter radiotolerans]SMC02636.1 Sulfotransferase family protein [Rubrobacter radiotolerans DSM 5868]